MKTFLPLVTLLVCAELVAAQQAKTNPAPRPQVMSIVIGGVFGPSYEITYDRREIRYYAAEEMSKLTTSKPVVVKPTEGQWQTFLDELKRLNVWTWKRQYEDPKVEDGTYWRAVVSYAS